MNDLRKQVFKANLDLVKYGLVTLTWGNVSGIDRQKELVYIKPSGVAYDQMKADDIVTTDLDGNVVEGALKPSSDLLTHIDLYKSFPEIGGITHTHSTYATSFAQANQEITCFGTTHADHFNGPVPVTRFLTEDEVKNQYELNTGKIIIERFSILKYMGTPGVLVAGHGPFTWGKDAGESVKNSLILERIAEMAYRTQTLNPKNQELPEYILHKHYKRKHGPDAYYGQDD